MTPQTPRRREQGDGGYLSVLVAGLLFAVTLAIGLLVDGSLALAAHREANNQAEQAARAAGQALDLSGYTSGDGAGGVDPVAARAAAEAYLEPTGNDYTIEVVGRQVVVTVTVVQDLRVLGAVGAGPVTAVGTGRSTQLFGAE